MGDTPAGQLYWSRWIDGYHFLGLNTDLDLKDSAYLSPEQIAWVDKELAIKAELDKPIFLQIRQTFKGTFDTYGGDTIYYPEDSGYPKNSPEVDYDCEEALKEVLKKYPQVVIFTGHVHTSINNLKVYPKEYGHVVDLPDFKSNLAYQVSVKDNEVKLRLRDYENNKWIDNKEIAFTVKGNGTSGGGSETEPSSSESGTTKPSSSESGKVDSKEDLISNSNDTNNSEMNNSSDNSASESNKSDDLPETGEKNTSI